MANGCRFDRPTKRLWKPFPPARDEALKLAREALEPFATEAHRLDVGINRSDLDHKWTQTAKAQVSYGMLRRVLEALAAIDGIDGIDAVKKGEQS